MSSSSIGKGRKDVSQLIKDHTSGPARATTSSCEASVVMLPKALTVSPTDLFPEEQFESSDSEDDAELHAFTQRLDADWRSNLSQALSWNAKSPRTVTKSPVKASQASRQADKDGLVRSINEPDATSGVIIKAVDKAVDSLCHDIEAQVLLSDDITAQIQSKDEQPNHDSGMNFLIEHLCCRCVLLYAAVCCSRR